MRLYCEKTDGENRHHPRTDTGAHGGGAGARAHGVTDTHGNSDARSHADSDAYAYACADSNAYTCADSDAHACTDTNT